MIRSEREYARAKERLREHRNRVRRHRALLKKEGMSKAAMDRALGPLREFSKELAGEIRQYEQVKAGEFDALKNLRGLGDLLVSLRIARGLSQKELAARMGAHPTQVSRDERSGYLHADMGRVARVLEAMEVELVSVIEGRVVPFGEDS